MGTYEIIKEITRLPVNRRIFIVERTLKSIREAEEKPALTSDRDGVEKAVSALLHDYSHDKELTAFTGIDFDKFYETR